MAVITANTVKVILTVVDAVCPKLSVTVNPILVELVGVVGVPDIRPVVEFKLKPAGNNVDAV